MSVLITSIKEGKCFVTSGHQVRRVLEVDAENVTYEFRGKKNVQGIWGPKIPVAIEKFAADVDREVTCDHNSDYPDIPLPVDEESDDGEG